MRLKMKWMCLLAVLPCTAASVAETVTEGRVYHHEPAANYKSLYQYSRAAFRTGINQETSEHDPTNEHLPTYGLSSSLGSNPLVAAVSLSTNLEIPPKPLYNNHLDYLPVNPFIALLLSHYGKYIPIYGTGHGIYAYNAVNNYHNNKPFGSYKVYENQ